MAREVPAPSVALTSFACPHCGTFTTQQWFSPYGEFMTGDAAHPFIPDVVLMKDRTFSSQEREERATWEEVWIPWAERMALGEPFRRKVEKYATLNQSIENLFISECYECKALAIWIHDRLVHPSIRSGAEPSSDLPSDIRLDYEEARTILNLSPRGAAALLRLAVQKLCAELGEKGKNIDDDIASLVAKGLDPVVQQALDAVRVIGNEAVHPGQIDLRDDRDAALQLFDMLNFITEQMISRPRKVKEMYARIPANKQAAIDDRNAKAIAKASGNPK